MRVFLKLFLPFITMLSVLAVPSSALPLAKTRYGGTLSLGLYHKPSIINPILTRQTISAFLEDLIFNRLVRINPDGDIEPDLAQSWEVSKDGLIYTFYLKKRIKFHDGEICTAADVKFTYDKILDTNVNSPFQEPLKLISSINIINPYALQIILKEPSSSFIYRLTREIAPKHLLENENLYKTSFNFKPVGTGPFRFKEWREDNQITLEYNPDYFEGRPYLDNIVVKVYANPGDVWSALMQGKVDCVFFIERKDYEVVKNDPAFKAYAVPADYYYALLYNLDDPILADKKVREAIALAIDRKSLIERIAYGYGKECFGPFSPDSLGFNDKVQPLEYSPQKAMMLLREAGWEDKDNDGLLEKEDKKLELNVLVDSRNNIFKDIILAIRQQLQEIGIQVQTHLYNDDSMLTQRFLKERNIQAQLRLFMAGVDPDEQADDWSPENYKNQNKLWIYKNKKADQLFKSGRIIQDKQKRKEIYREIHKLIYQDQPVCFLYYPFYFHAISVRFKNTEEYFNANMPNYKIRDFFIEETK